MLEHKTEFEIVFDANGFMTEPEIPDTQLLDFSVTRNEGGFGVVIKLQFEEEAPFFLSFEGCNTLNVKDFTDTNFVSNILFHSTQKLLDDEALIVSDFELKYPETKKSVLDWIRKSGINRIRIGPDAGAEFVIYCKKIRFYR